jgi:hypothetical protein
MADNIPPSSADVTESGSLKLPEPSGTHSAVMGLLYLYLWGYTFKSDRIILGNILVFQNWYRNIFREVIQSS